MCRLPIGWQKTWGFPKKILIEAVSDILPKEILNRPKQGFQFPMEDWIRGPLKAIVDESLSELFLQKFGIFRPESIRKLYDRFQRNLIPYEVLWQLVILNLWMKKWNISSVSL